MFLALFSENSIGTVINETANDWILLLVLVGILLGIDLYKNRVAHEPSSSEAFRATMVWVACGLSFSGYVFWRFGAGAFGDYLAGYLIEKSLSVDNVFVWAVIFSAMAIPVKYQHRVLFWGIFGALTLRAGFVFLGVELIERFKASLILFGLFLLFTGYKMFRSAGSHDESHATGPIKWLEKFIPVSDELDGQKFLTMKNGVRTATPLLAALIVVELTDVIFAVDSVPAIFAITQEPYIVLSSNAFAILGLRAMYFLLADAREKFYYLNHALGIILVLVGAKMIAGGFEIHYDWMTWVSLGVITAILAGGVMLSLRRAKALESASADAH